MDPDPEGERGDRLRRVREDRHLDVRRPDPGERARGLQQGLEHRLQGRPDPRDGAAAHELRRAEGRVRGHHRGGHQGVLGRAGRQHRAGHRGQREQGARGRGHRRRRSGHRPRRPEGARERRDHGPRAGDQGRGRRQPARLRQLRLGTK